MGVAETGYGHTNEWPMDGSGQGSGNLPTIWCLLSCILFDCYDLQYHKAIYCHPDRSNSMEIGMIGFVDNTNGQTNNFQHDETSQTLPGLLCNLQANAQLWAYESCSFTHIAQKADWVRNDIIWLSFQRKIELSDSTETNTCTSKISRIKLGQPL